MPRKPKRPELVNCKVKPYRHPRCRFRVWYDDDVDGERVRRSRAFLTENAAWSWAAAQDAAIQSHGRRYGPLPPEARRAYDAFRDARAEMEKDGFTPPAFDALVATAIDRMRADAAFSSVTVEEAAELFNKSKKDVGLSKVHKRGLVTHLRGFCLVHGRRKVAAVTRGQVEAYLDGLLTKAGHPAGLVTRRGHFATLRAFFRWTADSKLCLVSPIAGMKPPKTGDGAEPRCYRAEDVGKIFSAAFTTAPEMVPVLALNFFCGLRMSEALRIDLAKVNLERDRFRVPESKTGPRLAHLTEAARAWLLAQPRRQGRAWGMSESSYGEKLRELLAAAKVQSIPNGGRHSYISYRTAQTGDVATVADTCGTSPTVIARHYRELVYPEEAERFFAIRPPVPTSSFSPHAEASARTAATLVQ